MAETAPTPSPATDPVRVERLLDLDAFSPPPPERYKLRLHGIEYPVRQIVQLTGQEELDLSAMDEAVADATRPRPDDGPGAILRRLRRTMFDRAYTLVRLLVPTMPEKVRLALQFEEARAIADQAWAYAIAPTPSISSSGPGGAAAGPPERSAGTTTGAAPAESSRPVSDGSSVSTPAS